MRRHLLAICVASLPQVAAADPPPVAVVVGSGARVRSIAGELDQDVKDLSPAVAAVLETTLAIRVSGQLAIGIHAGVSQSLEYRDVYPFDNGPTASYQIRPYDVGGAALYSRGRAWAAPWLGATVSDIHASGGDAIPSAMSSSWTHHTTDTSLAFGLTTGLDVVSRGADRVALFLALEREPIRFGTNPGPACCPLPPDYLAITFGVAYRRW
jgi:hypothetical protein